MLSALYPITSTDAKAKIFVKVKQYVRLNKALSFEIVYRDGYQFISTIKPPTGILE